MKLYRSVGFCKARPATMATQIWSELPTHIVSCICACSYDYCVYAQPLRVDSSELNPDFLHITLAVQYSLLATSFTHSMWKADGS